MPFVDLKNNQKRMVYPGCTFLYMVGWVIALIGLSMSQAECKDMQDKGQDLGLVFLASPFFTSPIGDDCRKGFRFFWWIWALNTIPPFLAIIATALPDFRGTSTSFFAVIAPLDILMANTFYDTIDRTNLPNDIEKRLEWTMAGFCILAGGALLMLLLDSLIVTYEGDPKKESTVQHADPNPKPVNVAQNV